MSPNCTTDPFGVMVLHRSWVSGVRWNRDPRTYLLDRGVFEEDDDE